MPLTTVDDVAAMLRWSDSEKTKYQGQIPAYIASASTVVEDEAGPVEERTIAHTADGGPSVALPFWASLVVAVGVKSSGVTVQGTSTSVTFSRTGNTVTATITAALVNNTDTIVIPNGFRPTADVTRVFDAHSQVYTTSSVVGAFDQLGIQGSPWTAGTVTVTWTTAQPEVPTVEPVTGWTADLSAGIVYGPFPPGRQNIVVTFKTGYPIVPDVAKQAATMIVCDMWAIASQRAPSLDDRTDPSYLMPKVVRQLLAPLKAKTMPGFA